MNVITSLDDYPKEADKERQWVSEHGFRSLFFVPMIKKNSLVGALGFYGETGKKVIWNPELKVMLQNIATLIITTRERILAEKALEQMALFAQFNPGPVLRIDRNGIIISSNPAAINIIGKNAGVGSSIKILLPEIAVCDYEDIIKNNYHFILESSIKNFIYQFTFVGILGSDCIQIYGSDITESKKDKELLLKLKTAIEKSEVTILITNQKGQIEYANPYFTKLTGYAKDEWSRYFLCIKSD